MKKFCFLLLTNLFTACLFSQSGKGGNLLILQPNKPEAYIDWGEKKGDSIIITLSPMPSTILINAPEKDIDSFHIRFNSGENKKTLFRLTYGVNQEDSSNIRLDDLFKNGFISLELNEAFLYGINGKTVAARRYKIISTKIFFEIYRKKNAKNAAKESLTKDKYDSLNSKSPRRQSDIASNASLLTKYLQCLLCNCRFDLCPRDSCQVVNAKGEKIMLYRGDSCKGFLDPDHRSAEKKQQLSGRPDLYFSAETNNAWWMTKGKNLYRPLSGKDAKKFKPRAGSDIYIQVAGPAEHSYSVKVDTTRFELGNELESEMNSVINNAVAGSSGTADTTNKADTPTTDKGKDRAIERSCCGQLQSALDSLKKQTGFHLDSLKKRIDSIQRLIDLAFAKTDIHAQEMRARIMAIDILLEQFNAKFRNMNFMEEHYFRDLALVKLGLKKCLNLTPSDHPEGLALQLIHWVRFSLPEEYWEDFKPVIRQIEAEYKMALEKGTKRIVRGFTVTVPDADAVGISLMNETTKKTLYSHTFMVRGGFNIDFSTGTFFTGLGVSNFDLRSVRFSYKETKDTVFTRGGQVIDSVIYTGQIRDTTGNLVKTDRRSLSFGAGFFAHGYWRSGTNLNIGLAAGVVYNSEGQLLVMAGVSPMFNVGKRRISFIAGAAVGKTSRLSSIHDQNKWRDEYESFETGGRIFDNKRSVPVFTNSSNSSDLKKVEKFAVSYFFGLSFNFASTK